MKSTISLAILVAAVPLLGFPARADIAPPETQPCLSKQAGDACTYNNASGTCLAQTCSKLDYANWDQDASSAPPSMTRSASAARTDGVSVSGRHSGTRIAPRASVIEAMACASTIAGLRSSPPQLPE